MKTKIIMLAHGSSNTSWSDAFVHMTQSLRDENANAALAFMELSEPSLEDVVATGIAEGFEAFKVLPLFLAKGRHLKKDVPMMIHELVAQHKVGIELLPPIGEHSAIQSAIEVIVSSELVK
jgi:sirohydrochlorin cobaltochelatase